MTAPDLSARHRAAGDAPAAAPGCDDCTGLASRVVQLEAESRDTHDHRTQVRTLLSLAGAVAVAVVLGAVTVRDTTLATAARLAPLESRVSTLESTSSRRDADDRGTREALIRLQTTVETLQSSLARRLDAIDQRLSQTAPAPNR